MDKKKLLQEAELADGVVGSTNGLETFFAANADPDVSGLDHGYVVGSVTDGKSDICK